MDIRGEFKFTIADSRDINLNLIEQELCLKPTKILKKGTQITKDKQAPLNMWTYSNNFFDEITFSEQLRMFIKNLSRVEDYVKCIEKKYEIVEINFYIRTVEGQFGFSLDSNSLKAISDLGIKINFHILSFGEVYD